MKKIFALLTATVVIASASFAQTDKTTKSDTTTHKTVHHSMHKTVKKGDSTMHKSTKKPS